MKSATPALPSLLIVDDVPANLVAIETILRDFKVRLLMASSGDQALEILLNEEQTPVVGLLDVQMPDMDGYELARLIRSAPRTRQMPIIFMSAVYQDQEHISKGYDAGAVDFLVKPINEHIVRAKITIFLELYRYRSQQLAEREQAFHMLFNNAIVGITTHEMIYDKNGRAIDYRFLSANPAFEQHTGLKLDDVLGRCASEIMPGLENSDMLTIYDRVVSSGQAVTLEQYAESLNKHYLINAYRLDKKSFAVTFFDISERKLAEEQLHQAASVFEYTNEGIVITDTEGVIIDVNSAFSQITGYKHDEVIAKSLISLQSDHQDQPTFGTLWQQLQHSGHWSGELWNKRKNGEAFAQRLTISSVKDDSGNAYRYVMLFSDVTEIKEHQQQLEHIAHYDALTNLPNRLLLGDRLQQAMVRAKRYRHKVAVIYLDLDGFKSINDTHGHEAGDYLLVNLAAAMKQVLRTSDTLSRLGGDEFVAILPALTDIELCFPVFNRLLETTSQPIKFDKQELQVSASVGISFYPQADDIDADQLLRQADQAMYLAKQSGKNRYHIFDAEQDRNLRSRHASLEQIRKGIQNNEFVLFYQPKVNMRTGEVLGVEALVRWQHPERGLLAPNLFLPIIDNHPLLIELGYWVLRQALEQFEQWLEQDIRLPVSINVDGIQLKPAEFVDVLSQQLAEHPHIAPGDLELEVLESSALDDMDQVSKVLKTCQQMGISVALDDFGTGYSSLSYLKRLPVQLLKIDQSFVRDMLCDPDDLSIIEGIMGLAHAFQRKVIAEGVETVEHGELLLKLGCELGQGYAIARPMPAQDIYAWVRSWQPPPSWQQCD